MYPIPTGIQEENGTQISSQLEFQKKGRPGELRFAQDAYAQAKSTVRFNKTISPAASTAGLFIFEESRLEFCM